MPSMISAFPSTAMRKEPGDDDNLWLSAWKAIGRWRIRNSRHGLIIPLFYQHHLPTRPRGLSSLYFGSPPTTADPPDGLSPEFVRESWYSGYAVAQATIPHQHPSRSIGVEDVLTVSKSDPTFGLRAKVPALPNLPAPAPTTLPSTLRQPPSTVSPHHLLRPLFHLSSNGTILTSATSAPFTLTHRNHTLSLNGSTLPISNSAAHRALVAYLELPLWGRPSDRHHNPVRALRETFPAPHPRPEVPHNVTIKSIHPSGTMILATSSNTNPDDEDIPPPALPLSTPLPPCAFACVWPAERLAGRARGAAAQLGRAREHDVTRVGAVIWGAGEGAVAGMQGAVAVGVRVEGLSIDQRWRRRRCDGVDVFAVSWERVDGHAILGPRVLGSLPQLDGVFVRSLTLSTSVSGKPPKTATPAPRDAPSFDIAGEVRLLRDIVDEALA
ncbi:hypothetical protein EDB89DRAFT_2228387 [Lactarius sanguifluus]|nr:hypothetical protein EDB89DRAFT_2228387 [Lactarius sanguifluus]